MIIRCRTENPTAECPESRVQRVAVPVAVFALVDAVVVVFMASTMTPRGRRVACEGDIITLRGRNDVLRRRRATSMAFVMSVGPVAGRVHSGPMANPLAPRHGRVVRALGEALFHHPGGPRPEQLDTLTSRYAEHLAAVSGTLRFLLLASLDVVRWLPLILVPAPKPFESLTVAVRGRLLERLERSRIVALVLLFVAHKTLLSMIFFEDPEELRAMGYPGDAERRTWLRLAPKLPR